LKKPAEPLSLSNNTSKQALPKIFFREGLKI